MIETKKVATDMDIDDMLIEEINPALAVYLKGQQACIHSAEVLDYLGYIMTHKNVLIQMIAFDAYQKATPMLKKLEMITDALKKKAGDFQNQQDDTEKAMLKEKDSITTPPLHDVSPQQQESAVQALKKAQQACIHSYGVLGYLEMLLVHEDDFIQTTAKEILPDAADISRKLECFALFFKEQVTHASC